MEPRKQYPDLLKKEVTEELAKIDTEIEFLKRQVNIIQSRYALLQKKKKLRGELTESDKEDLKSCWEGITTYEGDINKLEKRKTQIAKQRELIVVRDAEKVFMQAHDVAKLSGGKNKLYIGNRQFVAGHVQTKKNDQEKAKAKKRILDANNWTWGINFAWIEGGTTAGARIKIKENEANPNDYQTIPDAAYQEMTVHPRMTGAKWLELCSKFPNTILWHSGENRPTWTALEIEACLNAGYEFDFRNHRHRAGRVIELARR
jgi:hypothetical protein